MQIGPDLIGAITGSYLLDDRLLIIRNDSVYSIQMADQIDPGRRNPDIPNLSQRLFDLGSDSEIIRRSLLTSGELFRTPYLASSIDAARARHISLDATIHLIAAIEASDSIAADVAAALIDPIEVVGRAAELPSIRGLWPRFAAFFQSVEHTFQEAYQLALLFFPEARAEKRFFEGFRDVILKQLGEDTNFYRFAAVLAENGVFIRNLRACIEHEREDQRLIVNDFAMVQTGTVERPTIEVLHHRTPHAKTDLALFCAELGALSLDCLEKLAAHLAGSNINRSLPLPIWVDQAPEHQRRPDRSDICYLVNLGDQIARIG